jgi:hypothetical protein
LLADDGLSDVVDDNLGDRISRQLALQSDQKGVDVTVNQPSTESPTTGDNTP